MDNNRLIKIVDTLEVCVKAINEIKNIINDDFYDDDEKISEIKQSLYWFDGNIQNIKNDME